jgi:hypothetical protein
MTAAARRWVLAVLVLVGTALPVTVAPSALGQTEEPLPVTVALDRSSGTAGPGEKLAFVSTITNTGDTEVRDLTAHLNILTTDADVYVDPEDWSPRRTQYVDVLAAGDTVELDWDVQAVTSGPLVLYVSVSDGTSDQVETSGPFRLTVQGPLLRRRRHR